MAEAFCDQCGKRQPMHTVFGNGGRREYCCVCYVLNGETPADWHLLCMRTAAEKAKMADQKEPTPRLDHYTAGHLDDFGFDSPETLVSICAAMCERMSQFEGVSAQSRSCWRRAAGLSLAVEGIIREAIQHQDDSAAADAEFLAAVEASEERDAL